MGLGNTPPGGQETQAQLIARKAAERAAKYSAPTTIKSDDAAERAEFFATLVARKVALGLPVEKKYDKSLFDDATMIDVETVAAICGLFYKRSGKHTHLLFRDEPGKRWDADFMAATKHGKKPGYWEGEEKIGDNIDLIQEVLGIQNKIEAAKKLTGQSIGDSTAWIPRTKVLVVQKEKKPPILPVAKTPEGHEKAVAEGRAYLISRGISMQIIERNERLGALKYAPGTVLFLGFDEIGTIRSITRRSTTEGWKLDVTDSDKMFPVIFHGRDNDFEPGPRPVETVEGGVSGLALQTVALREGRPLPTVIVTGGCTIRDFAESEIAAGQIRNATSIVLNHEWESYTDEDLIKKMDDWRKKEGKKAAKENRAPLPCANYLDPTVRQAMTDEKQERNDHYREVQIALMQEIATVKVTARHPENKADSDWADVNVRQLRDAGLI